MTAAFPLIANETQTLYSEVAAHPALFAELSAYQKSRLEAFAREEQHRITQTALVFLDKNPGYDYPHGCEGTARMQYWLERVTGYPANRAILALFSAPTAPATPAAPNFPATPKTANTRAKSAELRPPLTLADVKEFFGKAGLGASSQSGEWGAALVALSVTGCLVGTPPEIVRWFEETGIAGKTSRRTVQNQMQFTEHQQFNTAAQGVIFKSVKRHLERLKA